MEVKMVGSKKRSLRQAKLDMDVRVAQLRKTIRCGAESAARLPLLRDELDATMRYLRNSRVYEAQHYAYDEKTPEDLEREIGVLENNIKSADTARVQLENAARFYRAYHLVVFMPKIRELKNKLVAAEYWVEQWQNGISAIDFDSEKSVDERAQEKSYLECEHLNALDQVHQIRAQLNEIKNIKYM